MQSTRLLAGLTGALVLGSACGGGGTGPNTPPVAIFSAAACAAKTACQFTDASTDDKAVTGWAWDFNDPTSAAANTSTAQSPTHSFATAGTYNVKLTVTDADGATGEKINPVTVTAAANTPPTAGFTYSCSGGNCTFTNTSTDADGTIASYAWNFGEPASGAANTSTAQNPTHTYTITGTTDFTVTLTATDNGGVADVETQIVRVSQDLVCTGGNCTLDLTSKSTITITVTTVACEFNNNKLAITQPIQQTVFADGCKIVPGTPAATIQLNNGAAFNAGTSLQAVFTQGTKPRLSDPDPGPAATRVSGAFPDWTIEIDDGGNTGAPGEPDFNDIVLTVHATVVP